MFKSKKNISCRICNNNKLYTYLDLGNHPPSNSFILSKKTKENIFPLKVQLCQNCGLSQLDTIVSAKNIFDEYLYLSSSSRALVEHYKKMTKDILKIIKPKKKSLIIDIGSNDGITLKSFPKKKYKILGIEPSSAANYAIKDGIKTEKKFFSHSFSKTLKKKYGTAEIITATNVFAHNDKIQDFVKGVKNILSINGAFIIEFPYLDFMLKEKFFDTIYHEHYSYLSITPLHYLFDNLQLKIYKIQKVSVGASGPALRVYVVHKDSKFSSQSDLKKYLKYESKEKFKSKQTYNKFRKEVIKSKNSINKIINKLLKNKKKVGGFGAPAKGNTLLNYLKLNAKKITAVSENNSVKIGKYTPGSKIPIVSDKNFDKLQIDYALLLSWNYAKFFIKNSNFIKKGGKFILPFPKPKIVY